MARHRVGVAGQGTRLPPWQRRSDAKSGIAPGSCASSRYVSSAATSEPTSANGVPGVTALDEELLVGHDRFSRMDPASMLDVSLIVWNANHEASDLLAPVDRRARHRARADE